MAEGTQSEKVIGNIYQKALDEYKRVLNEATIQYEKTLSDSQEYLEQLLQEAAVLTQINEPAPEPQLPSEITIKGDDVKTFVLALDSLLNGIMHLKESFGIK